VRARVRACMRGYYYTSVTCVYKDGKRKTTIHRISCLYNVYYTK